MNFHSFGGVVAISCITCPIVVSFQSLISVIHCAATLDWRIAGHLHACICIHNSRDTISEECFAMSATRMKLSDPLGMPRISIKCEVIFHIMTSFMYRMDNVGSPCDMFAARCCLLIYILGFTTGATSICFTILTLCIGAVHELVILTNSVH